jgi:hypothetical protein
MPAIRLRHLALNSFASKLPHPSGHDEFHLNNELYNQAITGIMPKIKGISRLQLMAGWSFTASLPRLAACGFLCIRFFILIHCYSI